MEALFLRVGIDPVQWRALVGAALKADVRRTGRALDLSGRSHGKAALAGTLVMLALMGGVTGAFIGVANDLFLSSTFFLFILAFVIASSLLVEYQAVVLSPADYRQLSFQPVTSQTFLAARLTSVLVYTLAMTAAFSLVPTIVFALARGGGLVVAATGLAAATAETLVVVLCVIGMYVTVLKLVPAARLTRALSYLQLVFSFGVYGSYMIVPHVLGDSALQGAALPRGPWTLLNPSSWFAGWIALASGERTAFMAGAAALSIVALAASAWIVAGRLSLDYAERLAEMGTSGEGQDAAPHRPLTAGWLFANAEARAVSVLVRAHFRYDNRFRLTVLSIVPLTLVYLFSGFNTGGIDPFRGARQGHTLVYMAVMMFPPMLRGALTQSDAYRAAWIFHGTPADKRALVLALRSVVVVSFLLPYLLFLGAIYVTIIGKAWQVLLHVGLLGLLSHLLLVFDLLLNPEVPFSRPVDRGSRTLRTFVSITAAVAIGSSLHFVLGAVYSSSIATLVTVAGLAMLTLIAEIALRLRLDRLEERAQFDL
jgi:hypothetical protein